MNPSSYDITLGKNAIYRGKPVSLEGGFEIYPGDFILVTSQQYWKFPCDLSGQLLLKSTIGRNGIDHMLAGWFDPDFYGEATMELRNDSHAPFVLYEGQRVAQMVFMMLLEPTEKPYRIGGRYHGQADVTPAREEIDESETINKEKPWVAGPWINGIDGTMRPYVLWDYKMLQRYDLKVDYGMSKMSSELSRRTREYRRDQQAMGKLR